MKTSFIPSKQAIAQSLSTLCMILALVFPNLAHAQNRTRNTASTMSSRTATTTRGFVSDAVYGFSIKFPGTPTKTVQQNNGNSEIVYKFHHAFGTTYTTRVVKYDYHVANFGTIYSLKNLAISIGCTVRDADPALNAPNVFYTKCNNGQTIEDSVIMVYDNFVFHLGATVPVHLYNSTSVAEVKNFISSFNQITSTRSNQAQRNQASSNRGRQASVHGHSNYCTYCMGRGYKIEVVSGTCPDCNGFGEHADGEHCNNCGGSGTALLQQQVRCNICYGTGQRQNARR